MDNPLEIDESYPSLPEKSEDVLEKLENSDPEQVQLILEVCKQLFTIGQQRGRDVEQKASILIGTMGVAVAISTAIGAFLVSPTSTPQGWPIVVVLALFFVLVLSSFTSVVLALRVVWVGVEAIPGPLIIFDEQSSTAVDFRKAYAADLFTAFSKNHSIINNRASMLLRSQMAFTVFVSTLVLIGVFIASVAILSD